MKTAATLISSAYFLLSLCFSPVIATPNNAPENPKSDALVQQGWEAWGKNDHRQVETHFRDALKEDPKNMRASIGLALLAEIETQDVQVWKTLHEMSSAISK